MLKKAIGLVVGTCILGGSALASDQSALVEEAKGMMQKFGGALKAELSAAINDGGPVKAIAVCSARAPEIAEDMPGDSGWIIGRSSHRLRNPDNAPDDFTADTIKEFLDSAEGRRARGRIGQGDHIRRGWQTGFSHG